MFGYLIFTIFSYPGNTGNLIFLISHILEILENGFSSFSHILEILEIEVCNILYNLEIRAAGGRWRAGGSRGCVVLPWIIFGTCSWKMNMVTLELMSKHTLFWKWLPRPNHYAHKICIEILCRTPVSILKYLSPRPQNHMKNSKYSFLA